MDFSIAAYPPLPHPANVAYLTMRAMFADVLPCRYSEYHTKYYNIQQTLNVIEDIK